MRTIYTAILLSLSIFLSAQPQIILEQIASGFSSPVEITHAGDERLFIVERDGVIKIIGADGVVLTDDFLDINSRVESFPGQGEIGLLGLAFHPDYENNGYFYVNYTNNDYNTNISRFQVFPFNPDVADPDTEEVLMTITQPFLNHNGGCLRFGPDGYLYIGLGDGGSSGDPGNRAQNTQEFLGKMLRIDVDNGTPFGIPADNPFVNDPNTQDAIWAIGLRNPWRFSFDKLTGDLWIADVGQGAWEEIDFQAASSTGGENYGWRCYEGNADYSTGGCGNASEYDAPVYEYNHNGFTHCSVTGGHVYRGGEYTDMQGYYFYADYCSGRFWGIQKTGNTFTNYEVADYPGYDISTFGEGNDGTLYAARLGNGRIYKLVSAACSDFTFLSAETDETCNGDNDGGIDLTLSGGTMPYNFDWSNGADSEDLNNLNAGNYSVTISDSNGCNIIESFQLGSGTPDNPNIQANSTTNFCEGELVVLNAYDLPAGYGYQWFQSGTELTGETEQSLTVTESGDYYITVTGDVCGAVSGTSNWITVTVEDTPTQPFINVGGPTTLCEGESLTLMTTASTPAGYMIQWYNGNNIIAGETGETLIVTTAGSYYAIYDGLCPTPTSNWTEVTVNPIPPTAGFTYAGDNLVCEGESELLTADAAPSGYTYQWYLNGAAINDETNQTIEVSTSGIFHVLFVGPCMSSDIFQVTFGVIPNPPVPDLIIIADTLFAPSGYAEYQWFINGNPLGSTTIDNFLLHQGDGNYSVMVVDPFGCTSVSEEIEFIYIGLSDLGMETLQINPNPFDQVIMLSVKMIQSGNMEVEIFDSSGKLIFDLQEQVSGNWSKAIDLAEQANGIYIINIRTEQGSVSRRLVKQ